MSIRPRPQKMQHQVTPKRDTKQKQSMKSWQLKQDHRNVPTAQSSNCILHFQHVAGKIASYPYRPQSSTYKNFPQASTRKFLLKHSSTMLFPYGVSQAAEEPPFDLSSCLFHQKTMLTRWHLLHH